MAEDGCSEIQYDLARQLLEENSGILNEFKIHIKMRT